MWKENHKIINIVNEKTFQSGLRTGKEKPRMMERKEVCLRRDLDDEGLGQNKVLCSFSRVELPMVNYHAGFLTLPAPRKQISGYPPASGSRTVLTQISPCRLFFITSLVAFLSAFCLASLFLLCRELNY